MVYDSPLRYPGGKAKLSNYIMQVIKQNDLHEGVYIEPYVGGGSVALSLLYNDVVHKVIINDKDRSIYAFWYSVLNETDALCRLIADTEITMDVWTEQKKIQNHKEEEDLLSVGYSTFFLNRTNRSGILKAGVIGGHNQEGKYKINARFNKDDLILRIQKVAMLADRIELHNLDAVELIATLDLEDRENTLIYLDPPYYVKGIGLYLNYYKDNDHRQIANIMSTLEGYRWLITYDNVPFIASLYQQYRSAVFELNYSASNSGKGQEIMIYSDNLIIPECEIIKKSNR